MTMCPVNTVAERLKHVIDVRDITPYRVAKDTNTSQGNITKMLQGKRGARVSLGWIEKVAAGLGIRAGWLAFGEEPMEAPASPTARNLNIALEYNPDAFSESTVEAVKTWAEANPDAELTPLQWTRKLVQVGEALEGGGDNSEKDLVTA